MTTPKDASTGFPPKKWPQKIWINYEPKLEFDWEEIASCIFEHEIDNLQNSEFKGNLRAYVPEAALAACQARVRELEGALNTVAPIVEAAFWDHYTAGNLPGSGYSHKVYGMVSRVFGWRSTNLFEKWKSALKGKPDEQAE